MQHRGDITVSDKQEIRGQITGATYVKDGGLLIARGQLSGGLIIEEGGQAIVYGQVLRNVINNGKLTLHGQVCGKIIGKNPHNSIKPEQIIGKDLEAPFRGKGESYSYSKTITQSQK